MSSRRYMAEIMPIRRNTLFNQSKCHQFWTFYRLLWHRTYTSDTYRTVPRKKRTVPRKKRTIPCKKRSLQCKKRTIPCKKRTIPCKKRSVPCKKRTETFLNFYELISQTTSPKEFHWLFKNLNQKKDQNDFPSFSSICMYDKWLINNNWWSANTEDDYLKSNELQKVMKYKRQYLHVSDFSVIKSDICLK